MVENMLREVLDTKSSLKVAKKIYSNELKIGMYPSRDDMFKRKKKAHNWCDDVELLQPREKAERIQNYTKVLRERNEKKQQRGEKEIDKQKLPNINSDLRSNRMQTLFAIYADQTSDSYRIAAKRRYFLPPLHNVLKVLNKAHKLKRNILEEDDEDEKTILPKIMMK